MSSIQNPLDVNTANPLVVTQGGTGFANTTAYALICGGTTTNGTLQHVSVLGTTGQILTSNGNGTLPSWQNVPASSVTFTADTGTPFSGNAVTIYANNASNQSGSTVTVDATSPNITINLSDGNFNTILGMGAGNLAMTGNGNLGLGNLSLSMLTTGGTNMGMGAGSLTNLLTGTYNISLGALSGLSYTAGESSNIVISSQGIAGENNVIRIGTQGTSDMQQNICYIAGITGTTPVDANSPQVTVTDNQGNLTVVPDTVAGYVLTSNFPNSPTFQVASGGSGFSSIQVQTFTSSGTYTPSSGMSYCTIECFGAGGGGGGSGYSSNDMNAGGGGSGGAGRLVASAATIGASKTVTIGTGGTGGTGGNSNTLTNATGGTSGGTSSVGSLISCTGGGGGAGGTTSVSSGGSMGSASGTGVVVTLQESGEVGFNVGTMIGVGGEGGSTNFASGGQPTVGSSLSSPTGNNGSIGGGGGGGASGLTVSGISANGGNGGAGYIVITEYIS